MNWGIKQPIPVVRETPYLKGKSQAVPSIIPGAGKVKQAQHRLKAKVELFFQTAGTKEHIPVLSATPLKQPHLSFIKEGHAKGTESSANKATQKGKRRENKPEISRRNKPNHTGGSVTCGLKYSLC